MLKGYCTHYNYKDNMVFLQDMLCSVSKKLFGDTKIETDESIIDFCRQVAGDNVSGSDPE